MPRSRKRKTGDPRATRLSSFDDGSSEVEADEVAALIAEATASLAQLARFHQLDMLDYLLRMAHLEAEEQLRTRNGRKPS